MDKTVLQVTDVRYVLYTLRGDAFELYLHPLYGEWAVGLRFDLVAGTEIGESRNKILYVATK